MSETDDAVYAGVGTAQLRESPTADDGDERTEPYVIHGVALGVGDVTLGQSKTRKVWPAEELRNAAKTLVGQPLVRDHRNTTEGKIGEVTHAEFVDELGIIYEAEIAPHYEQLANDVRAGLMDVSVRAYHAPEDELESRDDGTLVVEDIYFDNLSVVNDGASPSNTARQGPVDNHPAVASAAEAVAVGNVTNGPSVATLERSVDTDRADDLSLTSDDMPDDQPAGPIADDEEEYEQLADVPGVYSAGDTMYAVAPDEHSDDTTDHADNAKYPLTSCTGDQSIESAWRLRGHGDYDIDQSTLEKRIRDAADAMDCDMDLVGMDTEENRAPVTKGVTFFDDQNNSTITVESVDNKTITVSSDDGDQWNEYMDAIFEKLASGDWRVSSGRLLSPQMTFFSTINDTTVVLTDVSDSTITIKPVDGEDTWQESRDEVLNKLADGDWEYAGMAENSASLADAQTPYTPEEGDWVEWQVNPDMYGQVVHNPKDEHIVMVEVYTDGKYDGTSTGHTLTAGYADVIAYEGNGEKRSIAEQTGNTSEFTDTHPSTELGRSNHEQYDVEEDDWVQWYPSETTEEHGFVLDVDDDTVTIEVWTQNADGEWQTDGEEITKDMELVEPWGNFPRNQEDFADAIEDGDPRKKPADNEYSDEENSSSEELVSDEVEKGLKEKVKEHNDKHGDEEGKKVTYSMLKDVYERGMGAYNDSHREGMSQQQWSYARVNAFLYLVRNGAPENDEYTQDNDLLPDGHERATEENASRRDQSHSQSNETTTTGSAEAGAVSSFESAEAVVEDLAEPDASMDELDEVYSEWDDAVNMTASQLEEWADHPCADKASVDPDAVLERNLELLETNKSEWTEDHISDAKRTVSFIARMSDSANEPESPRDGPSGCPSEWAISLLNWAYNPFDSLPEVPDELAATESMTNSDQELLASEMGPDHDDVFEEEDEAVSRSMELGLGGEYHEMTFDGDTYYVPGSDHDAYMGAVEESAEHGDGDMDDESEDESDDESDDDNMDDEDDEEMSSYPIPVASLTAGTSTDQTNSHDSQHMTEIDYEPASAEDLSVDVDEPVVVERGDLEDLSEKAQSAEDVEAELGSLTERLDEQDEAREIVSELSEDERELIESDTDATVVEASAAEMFDEVQRIYAEELADYAPFSADELADRFSPTELKDRVEDHEEANLSSSIEDTDPDPDGGSDSAEELAGDDDTDLREKMAEELESAGWHDQAEKVRAGEIDPVRSD